MSTALYMWICLLYPFVSANYAKGWNINTNSVNSLHMKTHFIDVRCEICFFLFKCSKALLPVVSAASIWLWFIQKRRYFCNRYLNNEHVWRGLSFVKNLLTVVSKDVDQMRWGTVPIAVTVYRVGLISMRVARANTAPRFYTPPAAICWNWYVARRHNIRRESDACT